MISCAGAPLRKSNPSPFASFAVIDASPDDGDVVGGLWQLTPWLGSVCAHLAFLLVLLLCSIPLEEFSQIDLQGAFADEKQGGGEIAIELGQADETDGEVEASEESNEEEASPEVESKDDDLSSSDEESDENESTVETPISLASALLAATASSIAQGSDNDQSSSKSVSASLPTNAETEPTVSRQVEATIADGVVASANSADGAVDRVLSDIRGRLMDDDLLVVWFMDTSLSLKDDRQRVATRLESFLDQLGDEAGRTEFALSNAVVTFGRKFREQVKPTRESDSVVNAIKSAPIDTSGVENIFTAIEKSLIRYRRIWKGNLMFVVWTDESGDDVARLNKTIAQCKKQRITVSVVGPSAILGAKQGLHEFHDSKTGRMYMLPVLRGPDTARPERIRLKYWFPPKRAINESWYGGSDLEGITSGFSPWGLTVLAKATGGSYTIFDRAEDQGPFDLAQLEAYAPAYVTRARYDAQLRAQPLRRVILEAVRMTYSDPIELPSTAFFGQRDTQPPYHFRGTYIAPAKFRQKLSGSRLAIGKQIYAANYKIESALRILSRPGSIDSGLDYEYQKETSPRWKAWYDLTRGRLLAMNVRLEAYRIALEKLWSGGKLKSSTNAILLNSSNQTQLSRLFERRVAEAQQLLRRCRDQNPDTPWYYLADRDLEMGFGVEVQQLALPAIVLPKKRSPSLPKF